MTEHWTPNPGTLFEVITEAMPGGARSITTYELVTAGPDCAAALVAIAQNVSARTRGYTRAVIDGLPIAEFRNYDPV